MLKTFGKPFTIPTAHLTDSDAKLLIDHFAISPNLTHAFKGWLPKVSDAGLKLSDHTGIVAKLT